MREVDVLICSTASPHPVVTVDRVRSAVDARGDRPLCILDIALPRDVDSAVGDLDNVFLYDLDDLRAAAAANLERREENVPAAREIIAAEVQKYWAWVAGLTAVPVVREFREEMDRVRSTELAAAFRRLGPLTAEQAAAIARGADGVVVGSALVNALKDTLDDSSRATARTLTAVADLVGEIARGVRGARLEAGAAGAVKPTGVRQL